MKQVYDQEKHYRRSIRLKEYDYSQTGAYFVTVCVQDRKFLFGDIIDGTMQLNKYGQTAMECWGKIPRHFMDVTSDVFVVMPNHLHGIVVIVNDGRGMACHAPTNRYFGKPIPNSLSTIIGSFKSAVTKYINLSRNTSGAIVWQRNYYEHIIRNKNELNRIREYIINNPLR